MRRRLTTSIALFVALSWINAFGLDFTHTAMIEKSGSKRYKAVRLTAGIYNAAQPDLADLLLYDKGNEPIPYFINSFIDNSIESQKSYDLKQINSFVKNADSYFDFTLRAPQSDDVTATSLKFEADRTGFAKKGKLWGGYDGVHWDKVSEDLLYDVDGNQKLELRFEKVVKYTYYRLELSNNLEKVAFRSAILKYNTAGKASAYFTATLAPKYTIEERGSDTVIRLKGLRNLKLCSIQLDTTDSFKRNVTFDHQSSKLLYHLKFNGNAYEDLTLAFDSTVLGSETSALVIHNNDDKPIHINGIKVEYLVDYLIFDGSKSSDYTLKFGNSSLEQPKRYDIASYSKQILEEGYDVLSIKEFKENRIEPAKPQRDYDYKLVFNITIIVVAVALGAVLLRRLKK